MKLLQNDSGPGYCKGQQNLQKLIRPEIGPSILENATTSPEFIQINAFVIYKHLNKV